MSQMNSLIDSQCNFFVDNHLIIVDVFKVALSILNIFGDLIECIWIIFTGMNEDQNEEITDVFSRCESLKSIILHDCTHTALNGIRGSFQKVVSLTFSTNRAEQFEIGEKNYNLNKIFPHLKYLRVNGIKPSDWVPAIVPFSRLTVTEIIFPKLNKNSDDDEVLLNHIVDFLKLNTQLNKLHIFNPNLNLLTEANDILPRFQELQLFRVSSDFLLHSDKEINFKSLKYLRIQPVENIDKMPAKITFRNIEALTLDMETNFIDKWIAFISRQVNIDLKIFRLYTKYLVKEHLLMIPDKFYKLEKMKIKCKSKVNTEDIMNFIKKCKHLYQLEIIIPMVEQSEVATFYGTLPRNWFVDFMEVFDNGKMIDISIKR